MTEEGGDPAVTTTDTISELKNMFEQHLAELKKQNEETVAQLNETIEQLRRDNSSLQAALVRSATMEPPAKAPEKTPEEKYDDTIQELGTKAREYGMNRGNY